MDNYIINTKIVFLTEATRFFNFPIRNSVRMSFWLRSGHPTTFSQLEFYNQEINIGEEYFAKIIIPKVAFLENEVFIGNLFNLGTYPVTIAIGTIAELLRG